MTAAARATTTTSVTVNGTPAQTRAHTLAELIATGGWTDAAIATAINGRFISRAARAKTPITVGDTIEIVSARQGG